MRGGLEKSARRSYAGQANPTRFLWARCGAGLCGTSQLALPPIFVIVVWKVLGGQVVPDSVYKG